MIMVTGINGFIGNNFVSKLSKLGLSYIGLTRSKYYKDNFSNVEICDMRDYIRLSEIVIKYDIKKIYHFAGINNNFEVNDISFFENNIQATWNILDVAYKNNIPFILLTSTGGNINSRFGKYSNSYFLSKNIVEQIANFYRIKYGIRNIRVLKLFNVYGPGDKNLERIVPYIITNLIKRKPIEVNYSNLINISYIDDIVESLIFDKDSFIYRHGKVADIVNQIYKKMDNYLDFKRHHFDKIILQLGSDYNFVDLLDDKNLDRTIEYYANKI